MKEGFVVENIAEKELDVKEIVAKRINLLLKNNGMTQKALADKCGLATAIINKATKGDLSVKSATKISKALGVSLDYLFGISDFENPALQFLSILKNYVCYKPITFTFGEQRYLLPGMSLSKSFDSYYCSVYQSKLGGIPDEYNQWLSALQQQLVDVIQQDKSETKVQYALYPTAGMEEEIAQKLEAIQRNSILDKNTN